LRTIDKYARTTFYRLSEYAKDEHFSCGLQVGDAKFKRLAVSNNMFGIILLNQFQSRISSPSFASRLISYCVEYIETILPEV